VSHRVTSESTINNHNYNNYYYRVLLVDRTAMLGEGDERWPSSLMNLHNSSSVSATSAGHLYDQAAYQPQSSMTAAYTADRSRAMPDFAAARFSGYQYMASPYSIISSSDTCGLPQSTEHQLRLQHDVWRETISGTCIGNGTLCPRYIFIFIHRKGSRTNSSTNLTKYALYGLY